MSKGNVQKRIAILGNQTLIHALDRFFFKKYIYNKT